MKFNYKNVPMEFEYYKNEQSHHLFYFKCNQIKICLLKTYKNKWEIYYVDEIPEPSKTNPLALWLSSITTIEELQKESISFLEFLVKKSPLRTKLLMDFGYDFFEKECGSKHE